MDATIKVLLLEKCLLDDSTILTLQAGVNHFTRAGTVAHPSIWFPIDALPFYLPYWVITYIQYDALLSNVQPVELGHMGSVTCPLPESWQRKIFTTPKRSLELLCSQSPFPARALADTHRLSVNIIFASCSISYEVSCPQLISFIIIPRSFIHVYSVYLLFSRLHCRMVFHCMATPPFLYPWTFAARTNKSAANSQVKVFVWTYIFTSLGKMPRNEIDWPYGKHYFHW